MKKRGGAVRAARQGHAQDAPHDLSVFPQVTPFEVVALDFAFDEPLGKIQVRIEIVRVRDGLEIERQQLFTVVGHGSAERVVDLEPAAVQVDDGHADGSMAKCALEELALVHVAGQALLRPVRRPGVHVMASSASHNKAKVVILAEAIRNDSCAPSAGAISGLRQPSLGYASLSPPRTNMRIARRFRGPPDSANGGYAAGLLANALTGAIEVTLRRPVPLEQSLSLCVEHGRAELRHEEQLVAEARTVPLDLSVPPAPSFARASEQSRHYVGHRKHHFPGCFVCGPARAAGDGLRIFPGAERDDELVAAPFVPDASLGTQGGVVAAEFVWAALDCVGYFASARPNYLVALLGRITAEIVCPVRVDEACVVIGWSLGREGRKLQAGTAVFGADGRLCGRARQTWIALTVEPPNHGRNARSAGAPSQFEHLPQAIHACTRTPGASRGNRERAKSAPRARAKPSPASVEGRGQVATR